MKIDEWMNEWPCMEITVDLIKRQDAEAWDLGIYIIEMFEWFFWILVELPGIQLLYVSFCDSTDGLISAMQINNSYWALIIAGLADSQIEWLFLFYLKYIYIDKTSLSWLTQTSRVFYVIPNEITNQFLLDPIIVYFS